MQGWDVRGLRVLAAMLGLIVGTALQLQQAALWREAGYAALVAGAVVGGFGLRPLERLRRGALVLPVALLLGGMAGAGLAGWRAVCFAADALPPALEGSDLVVTGVVAQMPLRNESGLRFALEVESARWPGAADDRRAPPQVPPRISLSWYADANGEPGAPLHAGERWRLPVRLKAPHGNLNPHGFDYELRLWEQGEQATGYLRGGVPPPERIAATWRHPIERAREAVRDAILMRVADRQSAGVIAALVTGDQDAIERADWDVFRATGVAHLMAISGLHVTMFAWLAALAFEALWRRSRRLMLRWPAQHAGLAGGVALAALYAAFSGWGVPSQRTVWMLAVVGLLRLGGRMWPWPFVWLLVCAVVVAIDPWSLTQPGFWLSFVAVGVLFAAGNGAPDDGPSGIAARIARLLREQWVVTLALTPLTLLLFQQISVVGLPANLIAIPWVTLVVTPLSMLGLLLPWLWEPASWAVQVLSWLLQWLASWPLATLSMPTPPLWMAAAGVLGGILLAMRLPWSVRALGLPLLVPALLWQSPRPPMGEFELLAADVGQGNAVLVRTASHSLLYDAGPRYSLASDAGHRVLVPLLRAFGERLDAVVLSHRDTDHTGGAPAVLAIQPKARLLSSIEADHPLQALRKVERCIAGQRWTWDGVDFEILHPAESDYSAFAKPNAISCVLRIGNGRATALLAGDIERLQETALVLRHADLAADVLLVPHHGSKTSSSPWLLEAVLPRLAIVQAGWRNRFGHPAPEVVERYADYGIRLIDTPHCGAATWSSTLPGEMFCQRNTARRYWHHQMY
ncbi:DNA internalization-related competence protein ComEC/Rec2 [Variovorax sp. YR216]|uniref:DNA internalization-related competence protein ComEC/Rec2 n=1 Tax=Variovorax sp. YR216 TaxID=1882828 RepID=UPI000898B474|nr:DNA internalization-related competence protein ComEC/Rec2 [Variovorax sp. YR216]SEB17880.1 competence protein ComEC [Variovorax sp. YR216]